MPGKLYNGLASPRYVKSSKAYCEGRWEQLEQDWALTPNPGSGAPWDEGYAANAAGEAITANPYDPTGAPTENAAWDAGWTAAEGDRSTVSAFFDKARRIYGQDAANIISFTAGVLDYANGVGEGPCAV